MSFKKVKAGFENLKDSKAIIECSNNMQDIHKNIEGYNQGRKCNVLVVFDDMIIDMICYFVK